MLSQTRRQKQLMRRARKLHILRDAPVQAPEVKSVSVDDSSVPSIPAGGYCEAVERLVRRKTRTVRIGAVNIGSEHRLATQTMATTLTADVEATVAQVKKCAAEGIDIVRVTVQGMKEAKACEHIRRRLDEDGCTTPIVADIH